MQDTTPSLPSGLDEEAEEKDYQSKDLERPLTIELISGTTNTPQLASRVRSYHVKTKSLSDLNQSSSQGGDPSWNTKVMILSSLLPGGDSSQSQQKDSPPFI
jgi:hypothetical protein